MAEDTKVKINLGCGGRPLEGYINLDMDDAEALSKRYPGSHFSSKLDIRSANILDLPFEDESVDEIRADSLIEHLSFEEEPRFFYEIKRVLKTDGIFEFSTPDFEDAVKTWLKAEDNWKDFYRNDDEAIAQKHWFGQYSYSTDNRWGYLSAMIFGSQNGEGQYHRNCYTIPKIKALLAKIGFHDESITQYRWKSDRDLMIQVRAKKLAQSIL
jgi:predicted SAM-dependent methyltransferase